MPIRIVRLFNVYGPGLRVNDKRAPADFAKAVLLNEDIPIFSDGSPKRTFCYVADSVIGEIKAIMSQDFDVYNIGSDSEEMTILELAGMFLKIGEKHFGYTGTIKYKVSSDKDYLTHDPQRRCPDLSKAMGTLGYKPQINPLDGIQRYLLFLKQIGDDAIW